jgi:hypothetical protein
MMTVADIERIKKVLECMIEYELGLSNLYRNCADIYKEDATFWKSLHVVEILHAENIRKMSEILERKPEQFEVGRPFNLIAINTALSGLKDNIKRIMESPFSREKMFILARDIEQSVLESNYAEIVKTADIEYQTLIKNILSQTYEHKMMIQKKINELRSKA